MLLASSLTGFQAPTGSDTRKSLRRMHVDPASRPRSHDQETVNEDLLVLYGLCHNYKALAVRYAPLSHVCTPSHLLVRALPNQCAILSLWCRAHLSNATKSCSTAMMSMCKEEASI